MRYQKLGHTGLFVSELCLGTHLNHVFSKYSILSL